MTTCRDVKDEQSLLSKRERDEGEHSSKGKTLYKGLEADENNPERRAGTYSPYPHFTDEELKPREPHRRTRIRTQTSDSNAGFMKLHGVLKTSRVPLAPDPLWSWLTQAGLGMLAGHAGGWTQGHLHKAFQASEEQEMAENTPSHKIAQLEAGLREGGREGACSHRAL